MQTQSVIERAKRRKQPKKPINFSAPVTLVDEFRACCKRNEIEPSDVLNELIYDFTYPPATGGTVPPNSDIGK